MNIQDISRQLVVWIIVVIGIFLSIQAGNVIADGGYTDVLFYIAIVVWLVALLTIQRYWWVPLLVSLAIGFSTNAAGFKIQGTDLMGLLAISCLLGLMSMGKLKPIFRERNLGLFFFLLLFYIGAHTLMFGLNNLFYGDTQFKNIAKAYYAVFIPLLFLWLIDQYADITLLKKVINFNIIYIIAAIPCALVVTVLSFKIPLITSDVFNFSWADGTAANSFLRWIILPILFLAVCLTDCTCGGWRTFYKTSIFALILGNLFGGGRVGLIMLSLFFPIWIAIRGKWNQFVVVGWLILVAGGVLFIMGHTLDTRYLHNMPDGFKSVERALSIFLPEDEKDDSQLKTEGSDAWHQDLAATAWESATKDMTTFLIGNGFKGWDDSIDLNFYTYGSAYDNAVKMAVRMGATETQFFSIFTIFGILGVLLYYGFTIELLRRTLHLLKKCPEKSFPHAMCVFSASIMLVTIITSPIGGAIPSYNMIYWILGPIVASSYLSRIPVGVDLKNISKKLAS